MFGTNVNLKDLTVPDARRLEPVDRGDPRRADRAARHPGDRQRAGRPRQAHGDDPARRAGAPRRRRQDARDRRAGGDVNAAIDRDFDAHVERIRDFLRIPSVSAADGDLRSTAAAVCELIEAAGRHGRDRRAGRAPPDRDRRDRRPGPDDPALRHVRRAAAGVGLDARPVRGRGRRRAHLRARRRELQGGAGRRPARLRRHPQPVPPGAADGGRGGARQPAAGRVLGGAPRGAARRLGARLRPRRGRGRQRAGRGRLQGPARARAAGGRRRRRALRVLGRRARRRPPTSRARSSPCARRSPPPT